jgi:hypothetical protein
MSDPQNPDVPTAPPAYNAPPPAYNAAPPAATQPAYSSAPPAPYGAPSSPTVPGKTMGIIAFILSFFMQLIALILGIVALVQSKKAGHKNGWALAAIIISSVLIVVGIIVAIVVLAVVVPAATAEFLRLCNEYGTGVHEINGATVTLNCP